MTEKTKRSIQLVKKNRKTKYAGVHLLAEFWHGKNIKSPKKLKRILITAAKKAKNIPLKVSVHRFSPQGITGVILLAESHIAFHSWPEINYLAIDIFTCGSNAMPHKALEYLKKEFKPKKIEMKEIKRGIMGEEDKSSSSASPRLTGLGKKRIMGEEDKSSSSASCRYVALGKRGILGKEDKSSSSASCRYAALAGEENKVSSSASPRLTGLGKKRIMGEEDKSSSSASSRQTGLSKRGILGKEDKSSSSASCRYAALGKRLRNSF